MATFPMTLSDPQPGFQGHGILTSRISQKRCVFGTKLLKNANGKPYTIYQMVPLSMEWYYVWWPWLSSKRVAQVCQHQLSFLLMTRTGCSRTMQLRSCYVDRNLWNTLRHTTADTTDLWTRTVGVRTPRFQRSPTIHTAHFRVEWATIRHQCNLSLLARTFFSRLQP